MLWIVFMFKFSLLLPEIIFAILYKLWEYNLRCKLNHTKYITFKIVDEMTPWTSRDTIELELTYFLKMPPILLRVTQLNAIYLDREILKALQNLLHNSVNNLPVSTVIINNTFTKFWWIFSQVFCHLMKRNWIYSWIWLYSTSQSSRMVLHLVNNCCQFDMKKYPRYKELFTWLQVLLATSRINSRSGNPLMQWMMLLEKYISL